MKLRLLLSILLFPIMLFASCNDWTLEVKGACLRPQSKALKKAFPGGWFDLEVQTSYFIDDRVELWGAVDWVHKRHNSREDSYYYYLSDDHVQDKLWILPLSIGSTYYFPLNYCFDIYFGGGVSYTFVKLNHHEEGWHKHLKKSGVGAMLKSGIRYENRNYFVDAFVDYFHQDINLSHKGRNFGIEANHVNFGGIKFGLGIGAYF